MDDNYLSVEVGVRAGCEMPKEIKGNAQCCGCYWMARTMESLFDFRFSRVDEMRAIGFHSSLRNYDELEGPVLLTPQDRARRTESG